jgi:zeaxanthin glucosyltransferase
MERNEMSHFGVLSYKGTGHLNPLIALSRRLVARGHRVTFFQHPELEQRVRQHGLEFFPVDIPASSQDKQHRVETSQSTRATQVSEIRYRLDRIAAEMEVFLREYPPAIRAAGVDTLIMGEIALTGPTVAEILRLPYFIVSTSIPHNFGWEAPRSSAAPASRLDRLQKEVLEVSVLRMQGPVRRNLDGLRRQAGLDSICRIGETFPELAHITQWPQCLDIDRSELPANFFYTGPFVDETGRSFVEFPWDQLDGRPLIYASLGTTLKSDPAIFHRIAEACRGLDRQLVISLGGRRDPAMFAGLPGNSLVVGNAPQLELLKRAEIVITHAGPNTVLETLMLGKPMLALPMTLDQPAVAACLARLGVAEVLSTESRSSEEIRVALIKVQSDFRYRDTARKLQAQMCSLHGIDRAVDIIEEALTKYWARPSIQATVDYVALTTS